MTIEIRTVRPDELRTYLDTALTAFLERPADLDAIVADVSAMWDLRRTWAAFEDGRPCGTFRSWATELTVPGGRTVPGAAVAGVTVLPTHRRRGILRDMVAAEHAAARERGEVVGLLYASEYPIYGRFGYGTATRQATWTLDTRSTAFHGELVGQVDLAAPDVATRDAMIGVFQAWRQMQPGEIRRRDFSWDFDLALRPEPWGDAWKGFIALHRGPNGAVDGYARYTPESHWQRRQPHSRLRIDELHALSDDAYAALWRFLATVDLVATLRAERRSPSERLPWLLTNARAAAVEDVGDALWVRLLDVPRALEARTYGGEGRLVLEVIDPEGPDARLRLALDASPDGARCTSTADAPDLTVRVDALGAAYLGGPRLRDAARAGGADEHRAGALADADRLFRMPDEPWCSTFF